MHSFYVEWQSGFHQVAKECASYNYPPTPPTARGSASEKTLQSARGKKGANCKSQREASRQRRKQGARASEQGGSKRDKEDQSKPTDSKPASFKSKRQGRKHQVQEQSQFPKHVASTSSMPKPKRCGRGGNILLSNLSYVWEMLFGASS